MRDLTDLSTRASSAGAGEQRELLGAAWAQIAVTTGCWDAISHWEAKEDAFRALLDINTNEAFTAAAMMLIPKVDEWGVGETHDGKGIGSLWRGDDEFQEEAATPALALLSAISRAERGEA